MRFEALKVGELARRTGVTVRTLHHYDQIDLLKPSLHSGAGHRLYTAADVGRLQQIISLRHLGFSLEQIRDCLNQPDFSPTDVIRRHVERLREQIEMQQGLHARLEAIAAGFEAAGEVSVDDFLRAVEVMTMIENYHTAEQLEALQKRGEAMGTAAAKQGQADWTALYADVQAAMEQGIDPADPKAQALEARRRALVGAFTGGDKGVEQSLTRLWTEQGHKLCAQYGIDPKLQEYLGKVSQAARASA